MIHSILIFLALNTASVFLAARLLTGFQITGGTFGYVLVGVILGILNLFLKPILKILSLPFIFLTAGLFTIVLNGLMLWLTQQIVATLQLGGIQFTIEGVGTYIFAVIILGVSNSIFHHLLG